MNSEGIPLKSEVMNWTPDRLAAYFSGRVRTLTYLFQLTTIQTS